MTGFFRTAPRVFWVLAVLLGNAATAQETFVAQCKGHIVGYPVIGQISVEYMITFNTYRHYGRFMDGQGNVLELEVNSNRNGGVGSVWLNGAQYRDTKIEMRYAGNQVSIRELYGEGQGQLTCN